MDKQPMSNISRKKSAASWLFDRLAIDWLWRHHAKEYPMAVNLTVWYVFGALSMIVLINQVITGIWLTMYYTPTAAGAFASVQHIMREVPLGWLLRYMHTTGATLFFVVIYAHMYRGLLYGSYRAPRELVWLIGVLIFCLLLLEAGSGYVLPWGQMSFWAGKVMVQIYTAIPWVGHALVQLVQGDYSLTGVVLHRFFAMHVVAIPLIIIFVVALHIIALHQVGSSNPDGVAIKEAHKKTDTLPFHPFFTIKDSAAIVIFLFVFFLILFYTPTGGGFIIEHINAEAANPLATPAHIYPAWYMAPFFAILRAVPGKLFGAVCFSLAIIVLFLLPWLDRSISHSMRYKGWWSRSALGVCIIGFVGLGVCGMSPLSEGNLWFSRFFMLCYFYYFIAMPIYSKWETTKAVPERIKR